MAVVWDMHQMINATDDYPARVIVHRAGVREAGTVYVKSAGGDSEGLKELHRLKGLVDYLTAENRALSAENDALRGEGADDGE